MRTKSKATSISHRGLMEALERRVFLSITDLNASFGSGGTLANPIPGLTGYSAIAASDGDVLLSGSQNPQGLEYLFVKVADVEPSGTVRWTTTINSSEGGAILSVVGAVKLANGGAVILTEDEIGNGSGDLYMNWITPAGDAGTSTFISGYGLDSGTYFGAMTPIDDSSAVIALETDDGNNYVIETRGSDGKLQTTFRDDAFITDIGSNSVQSIGVQSSGKIIVAGDAALEQNGREHLAVEQFNPDGSLDKTFGQGGKYIAQFAFDASHMIIRNDDEILFLTGYQGLAFTANGQIDPSFGRAVASTVLGGISGVSDVVVAPNRSLYVAGYAGDLPAMVHLTLGGVVLDGATGDPSFVTSESNPADFLSSTPSGELITLEADDSLKEAFGLSTLEPTGDVTPPTVTLGRLRRIPAGATTYSFTDSYTDAGSGVDAQTIQTGSVVLRYGHGHIIYGQLVGESAGAGGAETATYSFAAPNDAWTPADAATYFIETASDEVTDNAGNAVPQEILGSFTIPPAKSAKAASVATLIQLSTPATSDAETDWLSSPSTPVWEE